ncbi:hypothetical protein [Desulforhopalus sp. IMCC35007]|uniref:hypothetical protein n=1 Tax=Desulforhopalus sp. IMCC35007 TaxID=2569543 RepID=UPI0010AE4532|nr:hypothetical protein [Desulforhopalus sp. IMCC35007]TKB07145.1 hypothetical protein FCL48_18030 [Desulforhopalus sp. IMCC35007]
MNQKIKRTATKSVTGVLLSIIIFSFSGVHLPVLDSTADSYFKESITKAGVSYGVCRIINATVSVIKESSLEVEPAGIGLSLAIGQIVDPINDMVERLSNVLVMSITSLGVQELVYEISVTLVPSIMAVVLLLLSLLVWLENDRLVKVQNVLINILIIASIARFCLPISSIANQFLQEHFFEDKIVKANAELARGTVDLGQLNDVQLPKYDGIIGTIENGTSYLKQKTIDFKKAIEITIENNGLIIETLLRLTFLYLGIFIIQVLVLPLLIFWFMIKIVNILFTSAALTAV